MMPPVATFPPPCVVCEVYASVVGMELGKALRLLRRVLGQECVCGFWLNAHPLLHPHVGRHGGCQGATPREGRR